MRRSTAWAAGAVVVTLLFWGYLAHLSRQPSLPAIEETRYLFGWAIVLTAIALCMVVVALARQKKIAAFGCIMTMGTLIAIVGLAETASALKLVHWRLVIEKLIGEETQFAWQYDADREVGWRRRPNDRWSSPSISDVEEGYTMRPRRYVMHDYTYDAYGYRNPRTVPRADVVLIGDSYIEGANADDGEVVARRLEARLGRPVESMGVAGYGTLQQLVVLQKDAPKLDPKVAVWFFFEGNDLYDDEKIESMQGTFAPDETRSPNGMARYHGWERRSFVNNVLRNLRRASDPILPNLAPYVGTMTVPQRAGESVLFADYARIPWSDFTARRWTKALITLRQAIAESRARGWQLIICFLPIKERVYWPYVSLPEGSRMRSWTFWPIRGEFAEFCRAEEVPCLDLTAPLQNDVAAGNMPYLPTDSHWSAEGHELVAKLLDAEIAAHGWLK